MSNRVRITNMIYGPHGVGRLAGKAVFVRGVAPGEDVEIEIREQHQAFDYAEVSALLKASPERRQPPCVYLPRCGGCPWQHLVYSAQLAAKMTNLDDALRRIAEMPELKPRAPLSAGAELGYRSRLTLRAERGQLGFYAGGTHELVVVEHCLLAVAEINAALASSASLASRLVSNVRRLELAVRGFAPGVVLSGEVEGKFKPQDDALIEDWLAGEAKVAGITLAGKGWHRVWGDDRISILPEPGLELMTRAGAFTQVNPAANQLLVAQVIELGELGRDDTVLDLYAGAGNLTLPMARRVGRVVAVEQDGLAAAAARANAAAAGLANIEVFANSARRAVQAQLAAGIYFDTVVLDPPRSGAAECLEGVLQLSPRKLIYVSCNPATLARDLKTLAEKYRIDTVQPIDLFPQTYHLETVVRATRR